MKPSNVGTWPPDQLERLDACPVCRGSDRATAYRALTDTLFHSSNDTWALQACSGCGTHYLDPRPDPASIGRAYAQYHTHAASPAPGPAAGATSERRGLRHAVHALSNGYRNARWKTSFQPAWPVGRYLVPCLPPVREALVDQMRNIPAAPRPGARLLDVGCGNGAFLQLAALAGWDVEGTDFDPGAVRTARAAGIQVAHGGLELIRGMPAQTFDWITLSHVLEHVHEPLAWLRELQRILRPGGTLWLQTPNIASIGHVRYRENWRGLEPPRHLSLWTLDTLKRELLNAGFRQVRALPTPMVRALDMYASSQALKQGLDHAQYLASVSTRRPRLRHLWSAWVQHWSVRRSEFHTVLATR